MLDLDAYLERIGLAGRPTVAEVHRAHITSIPFENLDPQRGVPVSLALEDLQRKLVRERRGGYCFEQNLLMKAALEALGASVELFLARVRMGGPPGTVRPRTHLVLGVELDGVRWHADVGLGLGSPFEPIPFGPGDEREQFGWRYRVVRDGPELVLQWIEGGRWADLYGFEPRPAPLIDVEVNNWYTSTHPDSRFVTGLIVTLPRQDGARLSLSDWGELNFTVRTPAGREVSPITREEIPALLASRFGLGGFALDDSGRVVPG